MSNFILEEDKTIKLLKSLPDIVLNVNSNNIDCTVHKYSVSKKCVYIVLKKPIAVDIDNYVTLINKSTSRDIIGRGLIIDGVECERL